MEDTAVKILTAVIISTILGLGAWSWATEARLGRAEQVIEGRTSAVAAIPQLQLDIRLIRAEQQHQGNDIDEIKESLKTIERFLISPATAGGGQQE